MPLVLKDRVKVTSTTTGTGTFTLGAASTGFQSFSVIGDGNTTFYTIALQGGNEWEVGLGTYTASGTTLARTTVIESSNGGTLVNFSAGTKDVFVTQPAERTVYDSTGSTGGTDSINTNTANTVVRRDGSGNFSAGTITATLSGNATNVTGTVAIANGGTGATTRQDAIDALAGAVTSGQYLRGNGTDVVMSAIQAADVPTLNQNTTGTASNVTGTVAVANGGTGATTAPAAITNLRGWTTTATAAGTTTLTNASTTQQNFTGSTTQTLVLPVTSTLALGWAFEIINNSTGTITVNSSGGNLVGTVIAETTASIVCSLTSGTTAASWDFDIDGFATETGTGAVVRAVSPTITGTLTASGNITTPVISVSNGLVVNSNTVSASYSIPSGSSASSVGPITVASGQTVTVPSGSRWVVL